MRAPSPLLLLLLPLVLGLLAIGTLPARPAAPSGPAERGRRLFTDLGCYECHGYSGQGAPGAGSPLTPDPMGARAFRAQVRRPRALMPAYSATILPDGQLDDIYAYIASIPAGRPPDQIPLLAAPGAPAAFSAAELSRGGALYAANCAACHGPNREGGTAPALRAEAVKRSSQSTVDLVKAPPRGMPRLYPDVLSDDDVRAVAAYVQQDPLRRN